MNTDILDTFKSSLSVDDSIERKHPRTQRLLEEGEDYIADSYPDRRAENQIRQEEQQLEFDFSKEAQEKVEHEKGFSKELWDLDIKQTREINDSYCDYQKQLEEEVLEGQIENPDLFGQQYLEVQISGELGPELNEVDPEKDIEKN